MTTFIEYTDKQKKALAQLRRAFTRCEKSGLGWFNQYGTLQFYSSNEINDIDDVLNPDDSINQNDVSFEEVNLHVGEWSDDIHYVHFTDKGKKKYMLSEEHPD